MKTLEYETNDWIESHDALVTRIAKREAFLAAAKVAHDRNDLVIEREILGLAKELG